MPDILRIQHEASDKGFDSAEFFIAAPKGVFKAKWIDSYFGLFTIPDLGPDDQFLTVKQFDKTWRAFWDEDKAAEYQAENLAVVGEALAFLEAAIETSE